MEKKYSYIHIFARDVPVDTRTAFDWMTEYSQDDMRFYDAEAGTRSFQRQGQNKIKLTTEEREKGHELKIDGIVTLSPPDRWNYVGVMIRDGTVVASFEEYFSLDQLAENTSRFTIRIEARPLALSFKFYVTFFSKKLDAWLDGPHDRIVRAMVSECTGNRPPSPPTTTATIAQV
jgi:hypothetical protein